MCGDPAFAVDRLAGVFLAVVRRKESVDYCQPFLTTHPASALLPDNRLVAGWAKQ
jgi:hypothetical protein